MADRYYATDINLDQSEYLLTGAEAHHLVQVCRARAGTEVVLFNGKGLSATAIVKQASKREALLEIQSSVQSDPLPSRTIAAAIPKGDRALTMIEKCTELGVTRFIPLQTERSVTLPREGKRDRFERAVIEACKQCGRDEIMTIDSPCAWKDVAQSEMGSRWMFDVSGELITCDSFNWPRTVAIGPEGGWTEIEVSLAKEQGWRVARLPGAVLRVETAAIAAASLMQIFSR
ncbi:16S rRNA (uracil(1498)-N(3))-methyltransferase [bacterium]|nr:16S rRNA (uracil(1498)-N(3))-methyltransferase [bacterium]